MARERLGDLDDSKQEERERKLKLQEKNRRAQQAFRWRQKSKIQELSDQVAELNAKNSTYSAQTQELLQAKATLEAALHDQTDKLCRLKTEYLSLKERSLSNLFVPASTLCFEPSEDVVLRCPQSAEGGFAEHILVSSAAIHDRTGLQSLSKLVQREWQPQLKELNSEYEELMTQIRMTQHGSNRTKQTRVEELNRSLDSLSVKCQQIQQMYFECVVKLMRAHPVHTRLVLTDVLFNCHSSASRDSLGKQAQTAFAMMDMESGEVEVTCMLYESYLCNLASLRKQREVLVAQLQDAYHVSDEKWLNVVSSEHELMSSYLSASAATESLHSLLHKETELHIDLMISVAAEAWRPLTFMRCMVSGMPGFVDFLALLELIRSRHKPNDTVDALIRRSLANLRPDTHLDALDGQTKEAQRPQQCPMKRSIPDHEHYPRCVAGKAETVAVSLEGVACESREREDVTHVSGPPPHSSPLEYAALHLASCSSTPAQLVSSASCEPPCVSLDMSVAPSRLNHWPILSWKDVRSNTKTITEAPSNALQNPVSVELPKLDRSQLMSLPDDRQAAFENSCSVVKQPSMQTPTSNASAECMVGVACQVSGSRNGKTALVTGHASGSPDLAWLRSSMRQSDGDMTELISMLGPQGTSAGQFSRVDIVRVCSVSQIAGVELSTAQGTSAGLHAASEQLNSFESVAARPTSHPVPDCRVMSSIQLSGLEAVSQLTGSQLLRRSLAQMMSGALQSKGQALDSAGGPFNESSHQIRTQHSPAELAKRYEELMGEPI